MDSRVGLGTLLSPRDAVRRLQEFATRSMLAPMRAAWSNSKLRSALRITLGTLIALFIFLGPAYRQVFNGPAPWVPRWVMFSGKALGMMRVHIEVREPGSDRNRTAIWEDYLPEYKPRQVRQAVVVQRESEILTFARHICRTEGEGAAVFITADQATRKGWRAVMSGKEDLCRSLPRPSRKTGTRR